MSCLDYVMMERAGSPLNRHGRSNSSTLVVSTPGQSHYRRLWACAYWMGRRHMAFVYLSVAYEDYYNCLPILSNERENTWI
jgi:hypothetical protein